MMGKATRTRTPAQVKEGFRQQGITTTQWAEAHGYDRRAVYRVLNGTDKAHFGRAHEIAVALGLKVPDEQSSGTDVGCNIQPRKVA